MEEVNKNKTLNSGWEMATRLPAPYTQFPFICCKKWRFSPHFFFFKLFQLWHPTVGRLFQSKPFFLIDLASILPTKPPKFGPSAENCTASVTVNGKCLFFQL